MPTDHLLLGEHELTMRDRRADRYELVDLADEAGVKATDEYQQAKQDRLTDLRENHD